MSAFRFDQHPVVFLRPRISHPYAWVGHIPFAYLLIDLLRPRRLVELGTDSGNSYLAFCQAITHLDAATEATAIDSWEGDPHARFYGEAVYAALSAYHDPRYGKFSRLMRSYFDDAVKKFKDGSIDLLHIDGLHTYEAVKHDFQTWLPKLSDRAVVIFHDSQVRERGFGVWKFIDELRDKYRCFDFKHSNGLAVVEIGAKSPPAFRDFMTHALARTETVQEYFEAIAATIVDEKTGSPAQVGAERRNVECRVYYRNKDQKYDEQRSVTISSQIDDGPADLVFELPEGVRPDFVRLDPADVPCVFGLRHLALSSTGGKQRVVVKDEPGRIRAVSGELLPAQSAAWVRIMTFDSDPFVEISLEDVWSKFDKTSPVAMEFGVEYESVLSAPELIALAHSGAQSLQESRSNGRQQWGYPAIQSQVQALRSELQSEVQSLTTSQSGSSESIGRYIGDLAQHLDQLTKNQTVSVGSLNERMADISQRVDRVTASQLGSAESLGAYIGQLAQHLDQLTKNQTGSAESLGERMDRVTASQSDSMESMSQYIGQLAQHLDQLTRNQLASIEMQRAADARWHEQRQSLEDVQLRLRSSESRFEEIRRYQLLLSEQIDILTRQGVVQRIKRLLGR